MGKVDDFKRIKDLFEEANKSIIEINTEIGLIEGSLEAILKELGVSSVEEAQAKFERLEAAFSKADKEIREKALSLGISEEEVL